MIPGAAYAMRDAINEIRALSIAEMERRGKVATGRTISTLSTVVTETPGFVTGELQGESQWKFVGNGRGPGKMPPIGPIQAWIAAKGLDINAWAVAKNMSKRGSKDFRNNAPNVFLSAIDDFEKGQGIQKLEAEVSGHFEEQAISLAIKGFSRG
jgi:hypothetical protein